MEIEEVLKETHKHTMTEDYEFKDGDEIFIIDGYLIICEAVTSNIVGCTYGTHTNSLKEDIQLIWDELKEKGKQYIRIHPASKWKILFKMFPSFKDYYIEDEYMYLKLYGDDDE